MIIYVNYTKGKKKHNEDTLELLPLVTCSFGVS